MTTTLGDSFGDGRHELRSLNDLSMKGALTVDIYLMKCFLSYAGANGKSASTWVHERDEMERIISGSIPFVLISDEKDFQSGILAYYEEVEPRIKSIEKKCLDLLQTDAYSEELECSLDCFSLTMASIDSLPSILQGSKFVPEKEESEWPSYGNLVLKWKVVDSEFPEFSMGVDWSKLEKFTKGHSRSIVGYFGIGHRESYIDFLD